MNGAVHIDAGSVGIVSAIIVAAMAVLGLVWKLMGSPTPLSRQNLARPIRFVKRKYAACRNAATQRDAERAKRARREEVGAAFDAFEASVNQLRTMKAEPANYHESEWNRRTRACKEDALRYLRLGGVIVTTDRWHDPPLALPSKDGTIILDWRSSERYRRKVQLSIYWDPRSSLTQQDLLEFRRANEADRHGKILSEPLTDADMNAVGWEYPDSWNDDIPCDVSC